MQRHDTQPCGHPVCFTDQWTHSLLSSPVPVTQTGYTTPYTHMHTHTHTHHTPSHTPHTLHKHTHSSHPHSHILFTHTHSFTYTHPHTFLTYSQTYSSYPYKHTPSHTPYLHTHTHTEPTGAQTQETWGPSGSGQTPGTWSVWEQPRVPAEVSRWTFHTLGATGTSRSSLRTRETVEGLRLTQLGSDQTSLLCKICLYDQWTPHRRRTSVHSQRGSFLVKNTETMAPQIQTPFLSPQCPLPAVDPGQRGSPYLDHPPWYQGGGHRVPAGRGVCPEPS